MNVSRSAPSSSGAGAASSTVCPSDSSRRAVSSTAATHVGSTAARPRGAVVRTPTRSRPGAAATSSAYGRGEGRRVPVAGHVSLQHIEHRRAVAHRTRLDVTHDESRPRLVFVRSERDPTSRRFEAEQAAHARRDADRAAAVAGVRDGHHPARDRGRRTPARAAAAVREVPRVVRGSVRLGFRRRHEAEFRRVRLGDDHEPRSLELLEEVAGRRRDVAGLLQRDVPLVIRRAGERAVEVLDDDRDSGERPVGKPSLHGRACPFVERMDDGVELAVELLDAVDRTLDELRARRVAATHERGLGGGVEQ